MLHLHVLGWNAVMNTHGNPALTAVVAELIAAGAAYEISRSRHYKVRWSLNGRKGMIIVSVSSGTFAPNHARRQIRRQLHGSTMR